MMIKIYTDAATRPHSNQSGIGILIIVNGKQEQKSLSLAMQDNHHAEFAASIAGFRYLLQKYGNQNTVFFHSDSKIVIDGLNKNYSKSFKPQLKELAGLEDRFDLVINQWIPDKENKGAHNLANQALRKK